MEGILEKDKAVKINGIIGIIAFWIISFIVFWSYRKPKDNEEQIIIFLIASTVLMILLLLFAFFKVTFYKWTFVFFMCVGMLSLFIQPILNIPDEAAHFARSEMVAEGHLIVSQKETEFPSIQSVNDLQHFEKTSLGKTNLQNRKINYNPTITKHVAASNLSFLYFPQACGILIAKILHMDVIWMLWLGRIMNLICYSLLVSIGIKYASKWKFVLFFISGLPMSIQQAASFSPDSIINGLSILTIGYFIYLYDKKDITWKEYCVFEIMCILLPLTKITNIFIAGLGLLLPMENIDRRKRYLLKWGAIIVVVIVGGSYYLYTTGFPVNTEQYKYLKMMKVDSSKQLDYIVNHLDKWGRIFALSLINQLDGILGTLSSFGWMDYNYPVINVIGLIGVSKVCFQEKCINIKKMDRFLIVLMGIGIYAFSCFALYLSWTTVKAKEISGMQGRYLIPMIVLLSVLTGMKNSQKQKESYVIDVTFSIVMIGMMLSTTIIRYY